MRPAASPGQILDVPEESSPIVGRAVTPDQGILAATGAPWGVDLWTLPLGQHVTNLSDPPEADRAYFTPSGLVLDAAGEVVVWCPGNGGGGTGGSGGGTEPITTACSGASSYVADFDGDGVVDCATSPTRAELDFHKGVDGTLVQLVPVVSVDLGCLPTSPSSHVTADMNGDGRADLVFITPDTGGAPTDPYDALMIAGRSDGTFRCSPELPTRLASTMAGVAPVIGDYEGGLGAKGKFSSLDSSPRRWGTTTRFSWACFTGRARRRRFQSSFTR